MGNSNNLNKEKECGCNSKHVDKYEVALEEEKVKADSSKPCDPSNPDYPWVSCGIDKKSEGKK
ncbi:hypothetical protein [Clostridium saccharobutylicum]|uniref:Uncharacterized protein n=1 Tax=Clostridium saccharobutylicum DSM 13864 TaxID=1345695 RepID=U5MQ52_CLOSA|nr:hypothetical protein [Clostridium saccharobutylicum]AGX42720.1 hypothetical protein CLSA_c17260 [Clostridium saccharobutylicum DSM 13864]AQR90014.1 hypothetical protein CLOSC_17210 [Clostridium saccharobutylicum]AQR99919.1 hypothetical protein CSACC_17280 [Clostridium saccharobutylicum]AQS09649.1 hypothetical protein CLOBY_17800 [Clostridium saccharobutylicum]AQS13903.1 hypothetical protein CLOSACC_17280 [Clostridium saccharobutylicum]